ncbi:Os02g0713801, partial [Oryza sativa Japonica Group]
MVMHCELSTFCAGSCPVAMNNAVTILLAWALKPPRAPATADPARFLIMLSSTSFSTVVLRTFCTTSPLIIASQTTDFPRPSIQFTAVGFLSEQ